MNGRFINWVFVVPSNYAIKGTSAWTWHSNQKQPASMRRSLILVVRCQMQKLPKFWTEYTADWRSEPMAYWVHIPQDQTNWQSATDFIPVAPKPEGKKGFPVLCVEVADMIFRFSSRAQIEECIRVLSKKPLPSSKRLSALRGTEVGPNSHWLSRLPANVKSAKGRSAVVQKLSLVANRVGI